MPAPKGFGRNYFSLAAIQAHASARTLTAQVTYAYTLTQSRFETEAETESSPEMLCEPLSKEPDSRPSHCNSVFARLFFNRLRRALSIFILLLSHQKITSGIAPPLYLRVYSYKK